MSDTDTDSTEQYRVVCDDCGLDAPYSNKDIAIGRGLAHNDVTGHVAHVEGGDTR